MGVYDTTNKKTNTKLVNLSDYKKIVLAAPVIEESVAPKQETQNDPVVVISTTVADRFNAQIAEYIHRGYKITSTEITSDTHGKFARVLYSAILMLPENHILNL